MTVISLKFGYHPDPIEIDAGGVTIRSLPERQTAVDELRDAEDIEKGWIYAPPQQSRDFMTGEVHDKPYPARVFGLPKTHTITHRNAENEDHITFHLWSLSFFTGLRLTATEAGFLDATPLRPGKLVDFVLLGDGLSRSVDLADGFWANNRSLPRQPRRFAAAVHALFMAQYPPALQFERFLYLYTALDACYALAAGTSPPGTRVPHSDRAAWLCGRFGIPVPAWAVSGASGTAEVASMRNDALHEALYMGEPLGFALHGIGPGGNLTLELQALICRFLVALIGADAADYIHSPVDTRQRYGLRID